MTNERMAHNRDRLNALAAAELGRARTAAELGRARLVETQVEVSLTPATQSNGSSPAVRVTVNDVLDDKDTEVSQSDDSFDDNEASKYGREENSPSFCSRFRVPALPLGCTVILILLGLGALAAVITLSVTRSDRNSSSTTTNGAHTPKMAPTQAPSRSPVTDAPLLPPQVEHVIHITVDGLRPDYMNGPNFDRLKSEGACTLNARSDLASTSTLPNHIGMFTGLTVADHDYSANEDSGYKLVDANGQGYENIFDLAKEAGGTTAIYTSKKKFAILNRSWSVDKFVLLDRISSVVESFLEDMNDETYNFSFLHIASPDKAGHDGDDGASHWKYRNAVADADAYLGQVFDLIESNVELRDNTAIILTADHGFQDVGTHTNNELLENYRVPFCTFGPGVMAGADLIELNSRLNGGVVVDPGLSRGSGRSIRNSYAGVLAAFWLGLHPSSGPFAKQYLRYW